MSKKTWLGSPIYTSPEILKERPYSAKCDVWSLGIMLYQMLYYKYPFKVETLKELREIIPNRKVVIPKEPVRSEKVKGLLESMLEIEESDRIDWPEIFCHELVVEEGKVGRGVEMEVE